MTVKEVFEAAMKLDVAERRSLLAELEASLPDANDFASRDIEATWLAEVNRRSDEYDQGRATPLEWHELKAAFAARRAGAK